MGYPGQKVRSHGALFVCLCCGANMPVPTMADYPGSFNIAGFNVWKRARIDEFATAHANCEEPKWEGETLPLGTRVKDRRRIKG